MRPSTLLGLACALPLGLPSAGSAFAQTAASSPCASPQYQQFDFWLGDWEVRWSSSDGRSGVGANRITLEHDGCVVLERYRDSTTNFSGTSISMFVGRQGRWAQTWMDNGGTTFQASGGPAEGGALEMTLVRAAETQPEFRIRFEDITPNALTWRFQTRKAGQKWSDLTVSRYRRKPAPER